MQADSRVCEDIRDVQNHITTHCSAVVVAVYDTISCVVRVVLTKRENIIHDHLYVLNGLTKWKWLTNRLCEHRQEKDPHQNTCSE